MLNLQTPPRASVFQVCFSVKQRRLSVLLNLLQPVQQASPLTHLIPQQGETAEASPGPLKSTCPCRSTRILHLETAAAMDTGFIAKVAGDKIGDIAEDVFKQALGGGKSKEEEEGGAGGGFDIGEVVKDKGLEILSGGGSKEGGGGFVEGLMQQAVGGDKGKEEEEGGAGGGFNIGDVKDKGLEILSGGGSKEGGGLDVGNLVGGLFK
ncbi:glycine-rich RNA-binding protein GRP1A-like [Sphaeramia orbicularis]|uniref:glycine-rich RNA-binding protein GRP1A-like n=1 Tax=Sphaeramia orbicularis TaxID=375764 RepID=UPI00117E4CC3|nr:glycine-rich RNA-binding protein GRP1A-like [Sphaeramia orbicularis]